MLPKGKAVQDPDHITFIVGVTLFKTRKNTGLNQSLFVQAFLIFQYFQRHRLIVLVVVAMEDLTERTFADLFLYLVAIVNVVLCVRNILILFGVEPVVALRWLYIINYWHSFLPRDIDVVHCLVLQDLISLVLTQELGVAR